MSINLFSSKIIYLLIGFQDQSNQLEIIKKSDSAHELFKYSFEEFSQIRSLIEILPRGLRKIHQFFVQNFMFEGKARFFREINIAFIQNKDNYMAPVQIFFDIDFSKSSGLVFATFIKDYQLPNLFILVDKNLQIGGVTENISEKLGIKSSLRS